MSEISLKHPSITQTRTAAALDKAAHRADLEVYSDFRSGKWLVSIYEPDRGMRIFRMEGMTRTCVIALIALLNGIGDIKSAR